MRRVGSINHSSLELLPPEFVIFCVSLNRLAEGGKANGIRFSSVISRAFDFGVFSKSWTGTIEGIWQPCSRLTNERPSLPPLTSATGYVSILIGSSPTVPVFSDDFLQQTNSEYVTQGGDIQRSSSSNRCKLIKVYYDICYGPSMRSWHLPLSRPRYLNRSSNFWSGSLAPGSVARAALVHAGLIAVCPRSHCPGPRYPGLCCPVHKLP